MVLILEKSSVVIAMMISFIKVSLSMGNAIVFTLCIMETWEFQKQLCCKLFQYPF